MKKNTTKIFAYNGRVGIEAGDKFINDPTQEGQLGCVVDLKDVIISREALGILMKIGKSLDSIGDVMCWECDNGQQCFAWLGGFKHLVHMRAEGDRDYDPTLLESRIKKVDPPKDFIDYIDFEDRNQQQQRKVK